MELKLDDKGQVVVQDGKPVYVDEDGKTIVFDYAHTYQTIKRLQNEAKGHREAKEAAESALKAFEGIEDPDEARKALETVSALNAGDLRKPDEVKKIKDEAEKAFNDKLIAARKEFEPVIADRDKYKSAYYEEKIGGAFSGSKFISEKLAIPADLARARFGNSFTLDDNGNIIAKSPDGQMIYSRAKPGEIAGFDEAFETLVDAYPYKDSILKGSGASGSGAGGSNLTVGGRKTITRTAFDGLSPTEKATAAREAVIVD